MPPCSPRLTGLDTAASSEPPAAEQGASPQGTVRAKGKLDGRTVFVKGIPPGWNAKNVREFYSELGAIRSVNLLPVPSAATESRQAAFVNFEEAEVAAKVSCDIHLVADGDGEVHFLSNSLRRANSSGSEENEPQAARTFPSAYPTPDEILDGFLFIGNITNAADTCTENPFAIDAVLSVLADPETVGPEDLGPNYDDIRRHWSAIQASNFADRLWLSVADRPDIEVSPLLDEACAFLERARLHGKRVLVHCIAGRSRSATVILAYLMRHQGMTLRDAFSFLKARRAAVRPNAGFLAQLSREEIRLFGASSIWRPQSGQDRRHRSPQEPATRQRNKARAPARKHASVAEAGSASWAGTVALRLSDRLEGACYWRGCLGWIECPDGSASAGVNSADLLADPSVWWKSGEWVSFQPSSDGRAQLVTRANSHEDDLVAKVLLFMESSDAELSFPPSLQAWERKLVHQTAQTCGMQTHSQGSGPARFVRILK